MLKLSFKNLTTVCFSFIIGTLLLTGCTAQTEQSSSRQITHLGGITSITGTPQKVVALEYSFVDNLYQLGIKPIGIADDGDAKRIIEPIRTYVKDYTSVGKRSQPNLEAIQSLKPDFIIADAKRHTEIYQELQAIAPTILIKSLESNFQELEQSFQTIASVFQQEAKAKTVIEQTNTKLSTLKSKLASSPLPQKSLLTAVPDSQSINVHTSSSYLGNIIELLSLKQNVTSQSVYEELSLEQLITKQPEMIIYIRKTEGSIVEQWKQNPLYQSISAVKNNAVFEVNTEAWSRFRGYESINVIIADLERIASEVK